MTGLQDRAAAWHAARYPACTAGDTGLKAMSELGEVADGILAGEGRDTSHPERAASVLRESADVLVTLLALCGRFGYGDLLSAVAAKLAILETPGGSHPGCLPKPTLETVARRAGVSRSLASLALRGSPKVAAASREAVTRAASELGYTPDPAARQLAERRCNPAAVDHSRCTPGAHDQSPRDQITTTPPAG